LRFLPALPITLKENDKLETTPKTAIEWLGKEICHPEFNFKTDFWLSLDIILEKEPAALNN